MLDWIKNKTSKNRKDFGKYNFFVKSSPQFIDSSTTLTLTTYTNSSEMATIPCRYRWSIIKNGLTIEVPEFKGSSFKCEPSDVGAVIQAQVISTDMQFGGTAVIQFGPVKLDVSLKKQIQIALSSGCTTMPVYLCSNGQQKQCQIRLFEDLIKINHAYSQTNYTFDYTIFEPRIQCVSKDSCRAVIVFSEKYQAQLRRFTKKLFDEPIKDLFASSVKSTHSSNNHGQQQQNYQSNNNINNKLDIKFMNRNSRDIFLFVMKAFNTKKQLRSSVILTKIQKIDFSNHQTFDYVLQIQSLKSQLVKMDAVIKKSYQQKFKYMQEVRKLQKQIEEIIITYTRIVQEKFQNNAQLSRDYSMLSAKRDQVLTKKYRHLQNQNNHLNSRIQTLTKEIDTIRFKPATNSSVVQPIQSLQSQMPLLPPVQNPQQKVYFNYENYMSPFTKKKSGLQDHSNVVGNILDELGDSRISCISSIKEDPQLKNKLQQAQREKQQLQKKLQKSFHKIDNLEKDLFMKQQLISSTTQGQKMNHSAVHFVYNKGGNNNNNDSMMNITQQMNMTANNIIVDKEKQLLATQNKQLKKSNDFLKTQRQKLIQQLKNSRSIVINKQSQQLDNSLNFLKTQKKDTNLTQKQKQLIQALARKDSQIKLLKMQNQQLKKTNQKLRKTLQSIKSNSQHNEKLQKKVRQLQQQVDMYRKNSDALNRSQQLSMEMDNYNEQQIIMLKQHNEFLTTQNEKLSRACERYMGEAKQTNKLRMEIIKLKEKVNQLQMANNHDNSSSMVVV